MGLTNNQQQLIKAVSENDLYKAKQYAKVCLVEDKTQKNQYFVKRYTQILNNEPIQLELPMNLKGLLIAEDSQDFNVGRYYVSDYEEALTKEIIRMKAVSDRLMEMQIPYINATMLNGEPGVGKTMLGRYIAYRLELPFIYVNFSQLIDSLMGKTAANLHNIFRYVQTIPCVFMLDEIDCIALKRGNGGDSGADGELSRTVIALMQEFDRLPNNVVVIGATNRIDKIDPALLDRFSIRHDVLPLSPEKSREMIDLFLSDIGMDIPNPIKDEIIKERVQRKIIKRLIREISKQIAQETKTCI